MYKIIGRLMVLVLVGWAGSVSADPFVYTMKGEIAGIFNGVPYDTAEFVITGYADTTDPYLSWAGICSSDPSSNVLCLDVRATLEIEGIGTFDILEDVILARNNSNPVVGMIVKRLAPGTLGLISNAPIVVGWNLFTELGPISGNGSIGGGSPISTSGGDWVVSGSLPLVFQARPDAPSVTVNIVNGDIQECSDTNGTSVALEATVYLEDGDSVQSIEWSVNGTPVAEGASVNVFVPFGVDNTIVVDVMTSQGNAVSKTETITIEDTVAPDISSVFVDPKSGVELSQAKSGQQVKAIYEATDICDPAPTVTATTGAGISSGDVVKTKLSNSNGGISATIESSKSTALQMTVVAEDVAGNVSEETISITVVK